MIQNESYYQYRGRKIELELTWTEVFFIAVGFNRRIPDTQKDGFSQNRHAGLPNEF
jgi:hypothetical protein